MRCLIVFLLSVVSAWCSAQVQHGYVRTAGEIKKSGKPLSKVTIYMRNGATFLSGDDGTFQLSIPYGKEEGERIPIVKIQKSGYVLLDKDCLANGFVYSSSVPIEIVMISSATLEKRRTKIEQRARSNAEKRYNSERELLVQRLKENRVTSQQYKKQVEALDKQMKSFDALIAVMADRYARTDYDKLDSLNRTINECIVNGELERADSLINTKGDVVERAENVIKMGHQLQDARRQIDSTRVSVNRKKIEFEDKHRREQK